MDSIWIWPLLIGMAARVAPAFRLLVTPSDRGTDESSGSVWPALIRQAALAFGVGFLATVVILTYARVMAP